MMLFKRRNSASKTEYSRSMLPKNRREVFFDVLALNWSSFLLYGFLMLVFCLPLVAVSINRMFAINDLTGAIQLAPEEDKLLLTAQLIYVKDVYAFMQGACFVFIFLFLSGLIGVVRRYAWEENVNFKHEFAEGFKSNWLQMSVLGLIFGVLFAFSELSYNWAQDTTDFVQSLLMMSPKCMFILAVVPITAYSASAIAVYRNKFGGVIKIATAMAAVNPLASLIASAVYFLITELSFIANVPIIYTIVIYFIFIIIFPMILLAWMLSSFNLFDKYINAESHPELVGRGLVKPDDENEIG